MSRKRNEGVSQQDTAAALLLGASRLRLLQALLLRPGPPLHMRALGRIARVALGLLQRELKLFEEIGLVTREVQGKTVVFGVKRDHPLAALLRDLLLEAGGGLNVWLALQLADLDPAALVYRQRQPTRDCVLLIVSGLPYERWHERTLTLEPVLGQLILLRVLRPEAVSEPIDLTNWAALPVRAAAI